MTTEEERCAAARKFQRIDEAFRTGDLAALRNAVDDPAVIPNGRMPDGIGACLVYAVYWSPLPFIRTLLEMGADPNAPSDDGFPPLIAALCCTRDVPGANTRIDVDEVLRLLLSFGADPNVRGINDYTPLHMAVAERNHRAVQILLDAGANPELRTRIDECDTPLEMATAAGLTFIAAMLERKGQPLNQRLRSGLTLLADVPGTGEPVRRQHSYRIRLRLWLRRGETVRWANWVPGSTTTLEDNGATLISDVRINRGMLIAGLFYGVDGMRVGGMRRLEIAPHLAYGDRGVPGMIPARTMLTAEITILEPRATLHR
jgi:ankyrin repeat protein